jgi:hypothetical protein
VTGIGDETGIANAHDTRVRRESIGQECGRVLLLLEPNGQRPKSTKGEIRLHDTRNRTFDRAPGHELIATGAVRDDDRT